VFRTGPSLQAVLEVAAAVGAKNVVWNRRYEPRQVQVDRQVEVRTLTQHSSLYEAGPSFHTQHTGLRFARFITRSKIEYGRGTIEPDQV